MNFISLALNKVDTSMALLREGKHTVLIDSVEITDSKDNPQLKNLKIVFVTVNDDTDDKGKPIKAGYKMTRFFPIPDEDLREKDKNEMFLKSLCLLQLAVCDLKNTEESKAQLPVFDELFIADMVGKQVVATVKTSKPKDGDTYGPKSEVASVRCITE